MGVSKIVLASTAWRVGFVIVVVVKGDTETGSVMVRGCVSRGAVTPRDTWLSRSRSTIDEGTAASDARRCEWVVSFGVGVGGEEWVTTFNARWRVVVVVADTPILFRREEEEDASATKSLALEDAFCLSFCSQNWIARDVEV